MNFKEWFGKGEHFYYMESDHRYVSKVSYNAGQRSQQIKIDKLTEKHSEEKRILHNVIEMNQTKIDELQMSNHHLAVQLKDAGDFYDYEKKRADELQKRIDDALHFAQDAHSDLNIGMLKMVQILKGNKDEN